MYSPKIREEYIPKIYRIAKAKGTRMTTFVNEIIGRALKDMEAAGVAGEANNSSNKKGEKNQ